MNRAHLPPTAGMFRLLLVALSHLSTCNKHLAAGARYDYSLLGTMEAIAEYDQSAWSSSRANLTLGVQKLTQRGIAQDLHDKLQSWQVVVEETIASARDRIASATQNLTNKIQTASEPFLRGLMRTAPFQEGLRKFLEEAPFFKMLVWESDLFTAITCGLKLKARVNIDGGLVAHSARLRRLVCKRDCQQRLAASIATWMMEQDSISTMRGAISSDLRGSLNSWSASFLESLVDMPAILSNPVLRRAFISELANGAALHAAATPELLNEMFGTKATGGQVELVVEPKGTFGNGVKARITNIQWKGKQDSASGRPRNSVEGASDDEISDVVRNMEEYIPSDGLRKMVPWVMTALLDSIFTVLLAETKKAESDILEDPVLVQIVDTLLSRVKMSASSTRVKIPLTLLDVQVADLNPKEVEEWGKHRARMKCAKQVQMAKSEQREK